MGAKGSKRSRAYAGWGEALALDLTACLGGVSLASLHVLGALLLAPFFGGGVYLWGNVFPSFLVARALGTWLGDRAAAWRRGSRNAVSAFATLGGAGMLAVSYGGAAAARQALDRALDPLWACSLVVLAVLTLPGALVAAVVPAVTRHRLARAGERAEEKALEGTVRDRSLAMVGAVAGSLLLASVLLRTAASPAWLLLLLVAAALLGAANGTVPGPWRLAAFALVAATAALALLLPTEQQGREFTEAVRQASTRTAGDYYLRTAGQRPLDDAELRRLYANAREGTGRARRAPILAVVDVIEGIGKASITGAGLENTLRTTLDPDSAARLSPLLQHVNSVRTDGQGRVFVSIWHETPEGVTVKIPLEKGESVLQFRGDFVLEIRRAGAETRIDIGPVTVAKAGFLEINDRYTTPVVAVNAVGPFNATLTGFRIVEGEREVTVEASGQGAIGGLSRSVVAVLPR